MAGSVNKVILIGTLGKDPESRSFNNGGKVVNLRVATNESWKDKSTGERKQKTEWHTVAIFNEHLADIAERYLKSGSNVYLEGALQTRKWADRDGNDRYTTEIVLQKFKGELKMLGGGERRDSNDSDDYSSGSGPSYEPAPPRSSSSNYDLNDDIPF